MFDFGLSEMAVIGAVALVVLGPERMPVVARTAGGLFRKAQRVINQVKEDFERETELAELKKLQSSARSIVDDAVSSVKSEAKEAADVLSEKPFSYDLLSNNVRTVTAEEAEAESLGEMRSEVKQLREELLALKKRMARSNRLAVRRHQHHAHRRYF